MFKINWQLITRDECEKLQLSLNSSFAKLKLPDYVSKISVSGVNLGDMPPLIELMDISAVDQKIKDRILSSQAFHQFASPQQLHTSHSSSALSTAAAAAGAATPASVHSTPKGSTAPFSPASGSLAKSALHAASPAAGSGGGGIHPALRRASSASPQPATSNYHSATLMTPLSPGFATHHSSGASVATLGSALSPNGVGLGGAALTSPHDDDLQIKVKLHYNGNARFNIHSGLVINWPSPGFASLPITLRVSKLSFEGNAMIIKVGSTAYFTFEADPKSQGPLRDVCVESDIGDSDKSVLRNARKVEQFIISQLQTMLKEKLVYPRMIPANFAGKPNPNAAPATAAAAATPSASAAAGGSATPLAANTIAPLTPAGGHGLSLSANRTPATPNHLIDRDHKST